MATPSFGQMQHFFRLVEEGKITAENFQAFLGNHNKSFEDNGFPVSVDYTMTLGVMVAFGKYDWKNEGITSKNFLVEGKGTVDTKLCLFHLARSATTKQVEERLESLGLVAAKIEYLLAFGARYSDKQRGFQIVALGSSWVFPGGRRSVPYLARAGSGRILDLHWGEPDDVWSDGCRFLALSK